MKKIGMIKLQHLLYVLLMLAMTGCGASNSSTTAAPAAGGNGSVAAKLVWTEGAKSTAKTVAAIPVGVAKIRMTVTGANVPVVRNEIDVTGGATQGTVNGIYPGTVSLVVEALNASGAVLYEGSVLNVLVTAGTTTDVGTINMTVPTVKAADAGCLACHETSLDHSGQNLIADYKKSGHYTNLSWTLNGKLGVTGTGCAGCHGPSHNDKNPATSGRCFECHGSLGAKHQNASAMLAGDANPARYLNATNSNCSACHEPHNPIGGAGKQERKDWANSAHGDVNGLAWVHYDFTVRNTCNACHTTAGFIKALGNKFTDTNATSTTVSSGKQPLTCDGCHSSNDFKNSVRSIAGGYTAGMGGFGATAKANVKFSDQGKSNLCIPCHAGRENGDSLIAGNYDFTNKTFVNPHYLTSAAVWQGKAGFKFYSSSARYGVDRPTHGVLTPDLVSVGHAISDTRVSGAVAKGSCVACHLGGKGDHTFDVYQSVKFKSYSSSVAYTGCLGCHSNTSNGVTRYYPTVANGQGSRTGSGGYVQQRALSFLKWQFAELGIHYNGDTNPYFFTSPAAATSVTNWTTQVAGGTGLQTMGAAMNLKVLIGDKGAAAHNATFTKAMIADSLVYLQKGQVGDRSALYSDVNQIINFSNYSAAITPVGGGVPTDANPASIKDLKSFLTTGTAPNIKRR